MKARERERGVIHMKVVFLFMRGEVFRGLDVQSS